MTTIKLNVRNKDYKVIGVDGVEVKVPNFQGRIHSAIKQVVTNEYTWLNVRNKYWKGIKNDKPNKKSNS